MHIGSITDSIAAYFVYYLVDARRCNSKGAALRERRACICGTARLHTLGHRVLERPKGG